MRAYIYTSGRATWPRGYKRCLATSHKHSQVMLKSGLPIENSVAPRHEREREREFSVCLSYDCDNLPINVIVGVVIYLHRHYFKM